jgi:hypothetical protein
MGVELCVARRELPGARRIARLGLRPAETAAPPAPVQPREALRKARPERSATEEAPRPARPAATPPPRFSLAAVVAAGRLWIEELDDAALAREQVQLMEAIGRALDHPAGAATTPRAAQFDWPLHGNQQLDLGPEEAAAALQGFLMRQLSEHGCRDLMCCGDAARTRLGTADFPVPLRQLPATRTLLQDPELKRELWRSLRPR